VQTQAAGLKPALSVVVVIVGGDSYVPRCLEALMRQEGVQGLEIIVPCDERIPDVPALQRQFPAVRFLDIERQRTYAELRALGVQKSRGAIVALTEDHCTPSSDWAVQILKSHAGPHGAVGGVVEKEAPDTALNWAVYLSDYGRYMNPVIEGPARYLTDCNVSYKRDVLDAFAHLWADEFHEPTVHGALEARGRSLWLSPWIVVRQQRNLRLRDAIWDRYAFGRLFASTRVSVTRSRRRLFFAGFSFLLPPLLIIRIAVNVLSKGRHVGEFTRALPALILLTIVWAWGEFVGYLTGIPETSLMSKRQQAGTTV